MTTPPPLRRSAAAALALGWRARPSMAAGYFVLALLSGVVPVLVAWSTKLVLDGLADASVSLVAMVGRAVVLAALGVLAAAIPHASRYVQAELGRAVRIRAQDLLYGAVSRLRGLVHFDNPTFYDRLQLAQQASAYAPQQVLSALLGALQAVVALGGFLAALLVISPVMALVVLVAAVPAVVAELKLSRRRGDLLWRTSPQVRRQLFYGGLIADRDAAKEVRLFGVGDFLRLRMLRELRAVARGESRLDRRVLVVQVLLGLLGAAVAGAGLVWAVVQVRAGRLTAGDLVVLVAAVASVQAGLAGLVGQLAGGHQVLLQFGHFDQTLRGGVDLPEPEQPAALPALRKGIELRDVWFRYDESQPWVLRGVSLTVPCGQSVALVGLNGAGKSTLVKLLCRLYDPVRGSILWDGVDIRSVPVAELRARIAAVFQDHMNYDFTAGENIGLGDLDALGDPSRLRAAARSAEIDDTISALPRGYQTMLSRLYRVGDDADEDELGVPLSGGQWQRVALARGLVRGRRELLILDEPSSGLDAEAEHRIHQRLATMREGGAAVLISHRLNAVRMADQIVVLSGGAIVESGTHDELVAADGAYARLFRLQSAGYVTVRAAGQRP